MKGSVSLVAGFLVLFLFCGSVWPGQQLVTNPIVDNTILHNSKSAGVANTVDPQVDSCWVGINHYYTNIGLSRYDFASAVYFICFDLASLAGKTVPEAYLKLCPVTLSGDPHAAADYKVSAISPSWNTATVAWNRSPAFTTDHDRLYLSMNTSDEPAKTRRVL